MANPKYDFIIYDYVEKVKSLEDENFANTVAAANRHSESGGYKKIVINTHFMRTCSVCFNQLVFYSHFTRISLMRRAC